MRELCRAGPSVRIVAIARATDHRQHEAHAQKAASPSGCAAATHDMSALFTPADGKPRCLWCAASPDYIAYHDHEWGFPVDDDHRLFEKLSLEGFQSGLSWRTILKIGRASCRERVWQYV